MEQTIYPGDLVVIAGRPHSGKTTKLNAYIKDLQESGFICRPLNLNRPVLLKNTVYFLDDVHMYVQPSLTLLDELYALAKKEQVIIIVTIQTNKHIIDNGAKTIVAIYGERGPNGLPLFSETTYTNGTESEGREFFH